MKHKNGIVVLLATALLAITGLSSCEKKVAPPKDEHYQKGNDYLFESNFMKAKAEYELAIEQDSNNWKAYYQLANVYELEGDFGNSLKSFNCS